MSDVTRLLDAAAAGDRRAAADLLPLVYAELRALAAARMTAERDGHTLQPTALVHEAYLRLLGSEPSAGWNGRGHFFAAAAEAMRRILINRARDRHRLKRGGDRDRVGRIDLDALADPTTAPDADLLDLDDALQRLSVSHPLAAELVKLRFFAGLTQHEAAAALGLAPRTADRVWEFARAWLVDTLSAD
jgi:RNA polymerase sigma factor (TIGR02999 family)